MSRRRRVQRATRYVMWGSSPPMGCRDKLVYVCIRRREPPPQVFTTTRGQSGKLVTCKWRREVECIKSGTLVTDKDGRWGVMVGSSPLLRRVVAMPWCQCPSQDSLVPYTPRTDSSHFFFNAISSFVTTNLRPNLSPRTYGTGRFQRVIDAIRCHFESGATRFRGASRCSTPVFHYLHPDNITGIAQIVAGQDASVWVKDVMSAAFHVNRASFKKHGLT